MRSRVAWVRLGVILTVALAVLLLGGTVLVRAQADIRAQWATTGHANRELARLEATVDHRGAFAAHCARCHAEQGFLAWLPQLNAGNPGFIAKPDGSAADIPFLTNLGLTRFSVRPVTCATCHNPDFTVRVTQSTAVLPSGFRAIGVGLGAQCMTCHNSRNGARAWNLEDPRSYSAPHTASQADVIMGKNAFFVPPAEATISPHATFVGDACVTCHMRFSKASHTFKAAENVCVRCHGADMTAQRVQSGIETTLHEVEKAITARILARRDRIATIRAWDPKTDVYTDNVRLDPAQITALHLTEIHGQIGLKFTLREGRELYSQIGSVVDRAGRPVVATNDVIIRAAWNYFLIEGDDSLGVHNPRFARTVLLATLDALK
ncbi:MAG: hypothetical protein QN141_03755 [Armatimonadota bacterium]|nr:hypothetical protein [Armatimonadota bacterium]MDR7451460.1 hypothetical protein [Armatimonadota bacterium]MDR7466390.1 hypothetical protein [Armatimonadota bacterium]MDR7493112.1 hypothetical protein [Armatimonadota bacterium]MDR7498131.1 hypothetical protein [Armatimonadota bacterium]